MPKVLRIINRFNLGGPTYNAAYLAKYLSPGYETLLIGGMKDEAEESSEFILKDLGVSYRVLPRMKRSINPFSDIASYSAIKKIISEFKPDIVHTHAAKAGALGRRAAFACSVPATVHTFHGHVFHSYFGSVRTSLYKRIERNLAKQTSAVIAISPKQKHELVTIHKICPAEKVHVIPLGFDLNRFHEKTDEKRKAFREKYLLADETVAIGIVGRLVPVKNHSLFLEAVKFVSRNSSGKIKAFIIGDGESREALMERCRSLGLSFSGRHGLHADAEVVFTSWEKEPDKIYPGLDIVCLTSLNEGTPVSLIEAQAANRPIVSTDAGGIENVVLPGRNALLSDPFDKQKFCENLLKMVNDTNRAGLGVGGWEHVQNKFGYRRLIADTVKLYNTLLAR